MNKHREFEERTGEMLSRMLRHYAYEAVAESGVVTVRSSKTGEPDFQLRVTALDPELSGGFGISETTLAAVVDLMEMEAVTEDGTDRRSVADRETPGESFGYQIGTGIVSGGPIVGYNGLAT